MNPQTSTCATSATWETAARTMRAGCASLLLLGIMHAAGCATASKPDRDPLAEAAAARVAREKRLVALLRAGNYDRPGPEKAETLALIEALSGVDPKADPSAFRAAMFPTMLRAAEAHDPVLLEAMRKHQCQSQQQEARQGLLLLQKAQEAYRREEDHYGTLDDIGFSYTSALYRFVLESVDDISFVALARGHGEAEGDLWRISHGHPAPEVLLDRCSRAVFPLAVE